ncbi:hypothetical protein BDI4_20003 [Burkholderia diffusa]|nr:hypothetical protein BDI4_20003 [Burkholderia diffusa]
MRRMTAARGEAGNSNEKISRGTYFCKRRPSTLASMKYIEGDSNAIDVVIICRTTDTLIDSTSRTHCELVADDQEVSRVGLP